MCIIFIVISGFLAVSFYSNGDIIPAIASGLICFVLLFFFARNLYNNGACLFSNLFGKKKDCRKIR